jgi:putative ABC transport system substrate-binding protein
MWIRRLALALACAAAPLAFVAAPAPAEADTPSVAVTAIVEHPALDAVRDGVRDVLKEQGYTPGESLEFTYDTAQGNPAIASQIARRYAGQDHDVIVAISTPSAQAVVAATSRVPVVFSAVTDPKAARLVDDLDNPTGRVTGVSDLSPVKQQLKLIRQAMPEARTVGVIYNPGEANSVKIVELLHEHAPTFDFEIVESVAPKSSAVLSAARNLVGKADAIYVPTDNTIVSAIESAIKVGMDNDLPVFAADTASVPRGAVAALGFDYYDLGRQTGRMVVRVLQGTAPSDMPVEYVDTTRLSVNPASAERMGLSFPQSVLDRADQVVQD